MKNFQRRNEFYLTGSSQEIFQNNKSARTKLGGGILMALNEFVAFVVGMNIKTLFWMLWTLDSWTNEWLVLLSSFEMKNFVQRGIWIAEIIITNLQSFLIFFVFKLLKLILNNNIFRQLCNPTSFLMHTFEMKNHSTSLIIPQTKKIQQPSETMFLKTSDRTFIINLWKEKEGRKCGECICYLLHSQLHYMLRSQQEKKRCLMQRNFTFVFWSLGMYRHEMCFMYLSFYLCAKRVTSFVGIRRQLEKIRYDFCTKLFI